MAENRVDYKEACPTCRDAGTAQNLFMDLDKLEIRCELGHTFDALPSEKPLQIDEETVANCVANRGDEDVSQEAPAEVLRRKKEPEMGAKSEEIAQNGAGIEADEPSADFNTLESVDLAKEADSSAEEDHGRMAEIAAQIGELPARTMVRQDVLDVPDLMEADGLILPPAAVSTNSPSEPLVREDGAVVLPNGDLLLGVVVPEVWRQAVEAEAQNQLKSPAAYFSDWLTSEEMKSAIVDLLQNYWSASYAQSR